MIKYSLHSNKGIWHVSFYVKDINGKRKQKCLSTGFKSHNGKKEINKRKADEKAKAMVEEYDNLVYNECAKWTLDQYVEDWLERDRPHISPTTYDRYKNLFQKHVKPYFSQLGVCIKDIKPVHLERYCDSKLQEGLSPTTVIRHIGIISPALKDAVKNGYIRNNPAEYMRKPKRAKVKIQYYNAQQLQKLLLVCKDTTIEVPVVIAVLLGLRRSEIIGLRWSSIDFDNGVIRIGTKVISAKVGDKSQIIISDILKTEASESDFKMNKALADYLLSVKRKQDNYIRETQEYRDFVCVNAVGDLLKPDYISSKFKKILKENNLPHIRFHDLRHSCISILANNSSFSMKQIQAYARHADFTTTANVYSHTNIDIKEKELDSITGEILPNNFLIK